ncbi:MAG: hypothetical protein IPH86_01800 [bacterium]|nr:hypothetical protein [bacterium]
MVGQPRMARIGWNHCNLLGGGKGRRAPRSQPTRNVGGGLTWFGWLSPRTRVGAEWKREDEDTTCRGNGGST